MAENDTDLAGRLQEKPDPVKDSLQGQIDTDGRDADVGGGEQRGGESTKPDAITREDRDQTHALTPSEERAALSKRMADKRTAARTAADTEAGDLTQEPVVEPPAPVQQRPAGMPQAQPADEKRYKLRVNGADVELPETEVLRRAQMATASEDALGEAKRVLAEARRLRDEDLASRARAAQDAGSRDSGHQRNDDEAGQEPPRNQGKLREMAEALQTGDVEDAEQALERFAAEIRREQPSLSLDEVAGRAMTLMSEHQNSQQFETYFAQKHPEFVGETPDHLDRAFILRNRMHREIVQRLGSTVNKETGESFPVQRLQEVVNDPVKALSWYAGYMAQGVKQRDGSDLPNPVAIMDSHAERMKDEFNLRRSATPSPVDPNRQQLRVAEKRQLSEPRPAQTGQRQGAQAQQRLTPEQSRARAIEQRKAASGFSTA